MNVDDEFWFNVDSTLICLLGTYFEHLIKQFNSTSEWDLILQFATPISNDKVTFFLETFPEIILQSSEEKWRIRE